jgi:hypothetical protein
MRYHSLALVGLLAVLSVGVTACGSDKKSTTSASGDTTAKGGVVTIRMAKVGDPGNPSVGVWQVFKTFGTSGANVTLPPGPSATTASRRRSSPERSR